MLDAMPRPVRLSLGDLCYHVLNRGNGRSEVFHKVDDYEAFVGLIGKACERVPMRVLAFAVMPNHFHLVLQPVADGDLSTWVQWLTTAHVRRYHRHYGSSGHVWQGRFRSFPCQSDEHLEVVLRYVERNPLRAALVERAQDWQWASLRWWQRRDRPTFLCPGPIDRSAGWVACVNRPQTDKELASVRSSLQRGTPFGSDRWQRRTARRLGLECTLRPRGRPPLRQKK